MDFGKQRFNMEEPIFIHGEAVEITGAPSKQLNNWTQRGVIELGAMHRTGRRLYSIHDLIELKIISDLVAAVAMPPASAAAVAKWARKRSFEMTRRDEDGKLLYKGLAEETRHYLAVWFEDGEHKIDLKIGIDWLDKFKWPHPVTIVPLDDIVSTVVNKSFDVLEREHVEQEQ